jgi:hypothetical protein
MKKSEILMIRYANSSKAVFATDNATPPPAATAPSVATTVQPASEQSGVQRQEKNIVEPLSVQKHTIFNSNGVKLSKFEVQNLMRDTPEALNLYNSGKSLYTVGWFFAGAMAGCAVGNFFSNSPTNYYLSGGALVLLVPTLICWSKGNNKFLSSVKTYNKGIKQKHKSDLSLNFGATQRGVGFTINFN